MASIIAVLFLASLPPWLRMQRRFFYSTVWAKEHGYAAGAIKLLAGAKATTLTAKVAVADWQLIAVQKPGWFEYLFAGAARKEWKFSETPEGNLKVTITHVAEDAGAEYRLVAVDVNETEYLPNLTQRTKRADEITATLEATFAPSSGSRDHWQLPLSRVREVRLESRPYERVKFGNVSLQPGHQTTVEVKDFRILQAGAK